MVMSQGAIRAWYLVHKWTSIVCMAFLLMLCITGLPLIFHHEIDDLTRAPVVAESVTARAPVDLDAIVAAAEAEHPGWVSFFLSWDENVIYSVVGPSLQAEESEVSLIPFDARTGERLEAPPANEGVLAFLLELHSALLLGLPGTLFLGLIGIVFLVSVISGIVVYAPFMRKLAFATVRKDKSPRVKWLDTHNMVGIVTVGWVFVVGLTGVIITLSTPIRMIWQMDQLADMSADYRNAPPPRTLASLDDVRRTVAAATPGETISLIAWPGTPFSTQHHFMVAVTGNTPLTERLFRVALVDAETGALTEIRDSPWYVKTLFLSVPLHFGDYGGMALKIIWALLDIAAVVVLGSGIYLWLGRRKTPIERRLAELTTGGAIEARE